MLSGLGFERVTIEMVLKGLVNCGGVETGSTGVPAEYSADGFRLRLGQSQYKLVHGTGRHVLDFEVHG